MKKKDIDNLQEEQIVKRFDAKKLLLIILLVIVTLVGVFFLSTYIRWKADIKDKNEILYYEQDDIKINSLKDFYGTELNAELDDNKAILMYCSSNYGGECITGDFANNLENLLRSPWIVINIVILIDLLILYLVLKKKEMKKLYVYIISSLIVLYGIFCLGNEVYKFFDYYHLVNNTDYVTEGRIIKGIITENDKKFIPVVQYETEKNTYVKYLDYEIMGTIEDNVNKEITLYYNYKNNEIITPKRSLTNYILPVIISLLTMLVGILYFKLKNNKES